MLTGHQKSPKVTFFWDTLYVKGKIQIFNTNFHYCSHYEKLTKNKTIFDAKRGIQFEFFLLKVPSLRKKP